MTHATEPSQATQERIARNDAVFRDANERIRASAEAYDAETVPFLCECADLSCRTVILLSLPEYESIRASGRRFLNAPGHEVALQGAGSVVERRQGYVVVEKEQRAGEVAEALDPRGADSRLYERQQRIGRNEAIFREVNERLTDLNETLAAFTDTMQIVCECGDGECIDQISLSPQEYEALRTESTHFAVVSGHNDVEVEDVVESRDGYDVVQKRTGIPARIAEETDPRG
jgi:hypothetical protein